MTDNYERATELNTSAREAFTALPAGADPIGTAMAAISMGTVHALLAVADTIRQPAPQPVGACDASRFVPVGINMDVRHSCQFLYGHTGAHRDTEGVTW